jgi:CRP-like cAMP-binding protein
MRASSIALPAIGRGEWACLAEMISSSPAQADYVALDECLCLSFSPFNLSALRDLPVLERWLCLSLARGVLSLHSHLAEGGPLERILSWLLSRRRVIGGAESLAVSTTQAEIATCLGLSRETVNKRLAELEERGLISTGRAEIRVPDWLLLEAELRGDCDEGRG